MCICGDEKMIKSKDDTCRCENEKLCSSEYEVCSSVAMTDETCENEKMKHVGVKMRRRDDNA